MYEQLKKTIIDLIVKKLMIEAVKKASYLSWGPLNFLAKTLVEKVIAKAIEFGILELGTVMIKAEVNREVKEVEDLVKKYTDTLTAKQQKDLDEELKKAFDTIIKF